MSAQEFWQFREFYYPGKIRVDRNGLKDHAFYSPPALAYPKQLLSFKSKYIESNEYIIEKKTSQMTTLSSEGITYKLVEYPDRFELFFIKPISEMSITNGFFDYKDKDKDLFRNKVWFVATKISK